MKPSPLPSPPAAIARTAGALYVVVILCGLGSELGIRAGLIDLRDAEATARNILASEGAFRLSLAADAVMALADVAVAVLLFALFRPYGPILALAASAYRLVQTAIIGGNLLVQHAALLVLKSAPPAGTEGAETALLLLDAHAHGYDLSLVFFAMSCLLTAAILLRMPRAPRWLAVTIAAAGLVYLSGSALRFLAPDAWAGFAPAYAIPLVAEIWFALWLLAGAGSSRRGAAPTE